MDEFLQKGAGGPLKAQSERMGIRHVNTQRVERALAAAKTGDANNLIPAIFNRRTVSRIHFIA